MFFSIDFNMDYMSVSYGETDVCDIDLDMYLKLPSGLISWFYGFMCSEKDLETIDLDRLHYLSGSNYASRGDFKKAVKYALDYLYKANTIHWQHGVTRHNVVFWKYKHSMEYIHE